MIGYCEAKKKKRKTGQKAPQTRQDRVGQKNSMPKNEYIAVGKDIRTDGEQGGSIDDGRSAGGERVETPPTPGKKGEGEGALSRTVRGGRSEAQFRIQPRRRRRIYVVIGELFCDSRPLSRRPAWNTKGGDLSQRVKKKVRRRSGLSSFLSLFFQRFFASTRKRGGERGGEATEGAEVVTRPKRGGRKGERPLWKLCKNRTRDRIARLKSG